MRCTRVARRVKVTDSEFYTHLYGLIIRYQQRYLNYFDAEDCALAFLTKLWEKHRSALDDYRQGLLPESWVRVGAENAAKNFVAYHQRHQGRDEAYEREIDEESYVKEYASLEPSLEAAAISQELTARLHSALLNLSNANRDIFIRRYVYEEAWVDIAFALGDTADNVRQKAKRSLKTVRKMLESDGLGCAEANDYLAGISVSISY